MSTQKQKKLASEIAKNVTRDKPLNGGQIVENSGYGPSMKKNPKNVIDTPGVKKELQILGFDEESAKQVVGQILQDKNVEEKDRLKAADMVFKAHGTYVKEPPTDNGGNTYNFFFNESMRKKAAVFEKDMKHLIEQGYVEKD